MRKNIIKSVALVVILLLVPAFSYVAVQSQNQSGYYLFCQAWFPYIYSPSGQPVTAKAEIWGDVTFSDTYSYSNMDIILNGNLMVAGGGSLTLTNVTLRVNCTSNGQHRIEVQNGGEMYINDTDGNPNTRNDASNITSYDPSFRFLFWIKSGATFQMNNSELHYCGYSHSPPLNWDDWGLWINTNNTIIENNTITNGGNGLILHEAFHNTIRYNNVKDHSRSSFLIEFSDYNTLLGNNASKSNWGYELVLSHHNNLTSNTAKSNEIVGFDLFISDFNNLTGNTANDNHYYYSFRITGSSNNTLIDNTATYTGVDWNWRTGFYLYQSHQNNLTGNSFTNENPYDDDHAFYLENSSYNNLTSNTAKNNYQGFVLINSSNNNLYSNWAINCSNKGYYTNEYSKNNDLTNSTSANYLRIRVVEMFGTPIPEIDLKVDVNGNTVYATPEYGGSNATTNYEGLTDWILVTHQTYQAETPIKNTVEIWVSGVGHRKVDMSSTHTETFNAGTRIWQIIYIAASIAAITSPNLATIFGLIYLTIAATLITSYILHNTIKKGTKK